MGSDDASRGDEPLRVVHELTEPGRTRCGLVEPDLTELETTFHPGDPQACPGCRAATGD